MNHAVCESSTAMQRVFPSPGGVGEKRTLQSMECACYPVAELICKHADDDTLYALHTTRREFACEARREARRRPVWSAVRSKHEVTDEAFKRVCRAGFARGVHHMISRGATDWNGGLRGACVGGHVELVRLMISKGARRVRHPGADNCVCETVN